MCGIAGILKLSSEPIRDVRQRLTVMNRLQHHRGPDDEGIWFHDRKHVGFAHRRLSIIDLDTGKQPMSDNYGNIVVFNGEIYNYIELKQELGKELFETTSDTEVILHAYRKWGTDCVNHFRGMFSFALWDGHKQELFCARDRFGIKPFYYSIIGDEFYFSSEVKALLPFFDQIETNIEGFQDYLAFQFPLGGKTLFKDVSELLPAHILRISNGTISQSRYWEVYYDCDSNHTVSTCRDKLTDLFRDSVDVHLRSDVPVGAYVSGGLDSGAIAALGSEFSDGEFMGFNGKFSSFGNDYDESRYARLIAENKNINLMEADINVSDFVENISRVIYHLDYPTAGPGSFPQFMVSQLAAQHRKVVLGGQGGDEIFGGYTRYLIAYFEQCIKGAIDETMHSGNFIVTYESIIPNLKSLKNYKPLLQKFWREGLFDPLDRRYFHLINRASEMTNEINWELLGDYSPFETFSDIFYLENVGKESYFDLMTHFDFKTLLPALLQVEDRMSMAHGLESRVPFLDHSIVEYAATIPSDIKFKDGTMKHIFREVIGPIVPEEIVNRKDKMGFPTPLTEWITGDARDFIMDIFSSSSAQTRELVNNNQVLKVLEQEPKFGRKIWGLLSLELWQREFHDKEHHFKDMLKESTCI
ncbi:asparagine synthase (glutamine-hydrolyzing) [Candidatus Latescibacterota bacterium]